MAVTAGRPERGWTTMTQIDDPELARVFTRIRENLLAVVPEVDPVAFAPEADLANLGANSIDRADIVAMTMEDLGVTVPVTEFAEVRDVGTLAALLRRHLP